jgi:chromosome segregation ATPase
MTMDSDILREKFLRSTESLDRLGNDMKQLIFSRAQDLRESKDYLETLIKEKEAVDVQITEQEAKIASHQEEITNQANLKDELVKKQKNTIEELQGKKIRLNEINEEKKELTNAKEKITRETEKIKKEIAEKREYIASLIKSNQELEMKLKTEIDAKAAENKELFKYLETIKAKNAVISFLLEESAEDIPEVDILAAVMKLGRTTKEQLKVELEGRISPVMISRTLGRMAEKRLLNYNQQNDTISI